MKPTLYNLLRNILMALCVIIGGISISIYFNNKSVVALIISIIAFAGMLFCYYYFGLKNKKAIIEREEKVRIATREKHEKEKDSN